MTEQELRKAMSQICSGDTLTYVRDEGCYQVWRCNACGAEIHQGMTTTFVLGNPHYKPGCEPTHEVK